MYYLKLTTKAVLLRLDTVEKETLLIYMYVVGTEFISYEQNTTRKRVLVQWYHKISNKWGEKLYCMQILMDMVFNGNSNVLISFPAQLQLNEVSKKLEI